MIENIESTTSNIGIVYATDDNYAKHLATSLISIYENAKNYKLPNIYIIGNNLSVDNIKKIEKIGHKYNNNIIFLNSESIIKKLPQDIYTANLTISTYIRLFLADIIPVNIKKILYLDCDTYICINITELLNVKLEDHLIAGVEDTMYPHMKINIGLSETDKYINAGILLINLEKWREKKLSEQFSQFIIKHKGKVAHLDQGVINGVLKGHIKYLPLKYNVQSPIFAIHSYKRLLSFHGMLNYFSEEEVCLARKKPAIIHYTSFFTGRPWERGCIHPFKKLYYDALSKTDYINNYEKTLSLNKRIRNFCFKYFQPLYLLLKKI